MLGTMWDVCHPSVHTILSQLAVNDPTFYEAAAVLQVLN